MSFVAQSEVSPSACAVFRSIDSVPEDFGPSVVTVGNFDGVHCGHRRVIGEVVARARALQAKAVLVTLDPHPAVILRPDQAPKLITPTPEKLRLLLQTGLDAVLVIPFTAELARTSAREFAATVLRDRLRAVEVYEGENFRFGYQAEADIAGLSELGREFGFRVEAFQPVKIARGVVSSSRIRQAIAAGDLTTARHLLGRSFAVQSTPARGRGYGTQYAVPTVNLATYEDLLPANGVYVTEMRIGTGEEVVTFESVTNVGNRPTFGPDSFAVESFLFRFRPIALGESTPVRLTFLKRLREERKWPSPEALKAQIGRDVARAERWFALRRALGGASQG
ncbi:riboflavin biosynthesis protein RibF [Terriglobus aquaticus]|uniref:Riboflavin biosynthesis protein n=1 Tax=Terriglobus aquaticus TaxID=940139 RepID=A0ABW9KGU2_9BACT|nr:riboflavin biosynthesis protein RibF [Terriglobus aquaticus]